MNDKPDNDFSDDDDLDWLKDTDSGSDQPSTGDKTGLTGQLNWETISDDTPGTSSEGDELSFDWQTDGSDDDSGASRQESTGLTGQLDWQSGVHDNSADMLEALDAAEADEMDWETSDDEGIAEDDSDDVDLFADDTDFDEEDDEDAPLQGLLGQFDDEENEDDSDGLQGLLGQFDDDDTLDDEIEASSDADEPDWLSDSFDADEGFEDEPEAEAAGDIPDWLSVDLGDESEVDEAADFAEATEPDDTPDWLADTLDEEDNFEEDPVAEASNADWLSDMGFGEDDADADADAFTTDEAESDDTPDWLANTLDEEDEFEEDPVAEASDTDWLSDMGFGEDDTDADAGTFATDEAESDDTPDWLADTLDEEDEFEEDPVAEVSDADWLSDMGFGEDDTDTDADTFMTDEAESDDTPDWLNQGFDDDEDSTDEPAAESSGDAWFAEMGFGEDDTDADAEATPDWLEDDSDDTDFGFDFGDDDEGAEVATGVDTDYLKSMGLGDQGDASELGWFSEETTDDAEPDWLSELGDIDESAFTEDEAIADFGVSSEPEVVAEEPVDTLSELDALLESFEVSDSSDEMEDLGDLLNELDGLEIDTDDAGESIGLTGMLGDYAESDESPARPKASSLTGMLDEWELDDELAQAQPDSPEDIAALLDQLESEDEEEFDLDEIDLNDIPEDDEEEAIEAAPNFQELLESSTIESMPLSEDAPDWLRQLQEESGEDDGLSAAALVRNKDDKPLEDLPDRLIDLRERGLNLSTEQADDPTAKQKIAKIVPDVNKTLAPVPIETDESELAGSINLTPEQSKRAALLRDVVGEAPSMATVAPTMLEEAETLVGDADLEELDQLPEEEATPAVGARPQYRRRSKLQIDRILIATLLLLMIAAPFVLSVARFGALPSAQVPAGSPILTVYDQVEAIETGDLVLVAVEYGLAGTGELDGATDVLIRHILINGGRPVVVSSSPVGLLHSANIMTEIAATSLTRNEDYYILQYIPAGAVGLRDLAQNLAELVTMDYQNNVTGLSIASFDEFSLVVVIAEQAESVRLWAEQIAPLTDAPIVTAMSFAAVPLAQPYVESQGIEGMLVGYRDAYSYSLLLKNNLGITADVQSIPEETEDPTATDEPTATPTDAPTDTPEAESTDDAEVVPADDEPTATLEPTDAPTNTPRPTATPTEVPEETVAPTNTPRPTATPTEEVIETATFAVIVSRGAVNLRSGPGTDFAVVATANSGESFLVQSTSDDGTWYEIELPDGNTAWIADFLVTLEERELSTSDLKQTDVLKVEGVSRFLRPANQAEEDEEPELTPEATPVINVAELASGTIADDPIRWYAITLGTIGAVVVILLGNVVNIVRHLIRKEED